MSVQPIYLLSADGDDNAAICENLSVALKLARVIRENWIENNNKQVEEIPDMDSFMGDWINFHELTDNEDERYRLGEIIICIQKRKLWKRFRKDLPPNTGDWP